ncbi:MULTISPECIES: ferredoxin [Streptomyces]|uniref:Ferredoxin n=1 Tax=Streptomyces tirandamycinicus TaxID=2174846 RepID=A0A2S1SLZ2_9ACTN|nr:MULTISPECIES: ferredoxin [Streptomyces]AWI27377.1 ferredoxin [Streptomyces tirandamycinicus]MCY0983773.1 ferredoxin [Streptomyces tirandamycinicus]NNJ04856.1 ferredoxin [Streptomyces sp. PKU-MA01144]
MKLLLDSTRCQGYGLCREHAPQLIELDEWGYASVIAADVPPSCEDAARACADSCPNSALRLEK